MTYYEWQIMIHDGVARKPLAGEFNPPAENIEDAFRRLQSVMSDRGGNDILTGQYPVSIALCVDATPAWSSPRLKVWVSATPV